MFESLFNKVTWFQACNFTERVSDTGVFFCEYCKIFKNTSWKKSTNGCFYRLQKLLQSYRKLNWNEVWIKMKIYCLLFSWCFYCWLWTGKCQVGKQSKWDRKFILIFLLKLCLLFCFNYWKCQTGKLLFRKK